MAQTCSKCSRVNPAEASYCYYDGSILGGGSHVNGGAIHTGSHPFPNPFVFPTGQVCRNFDELAMACQEHWDAAVELLQQGFLEAFLGGLGRADLAMAAREAARFPDKNRGLDQLVAKLPSRVIDPPRLDVAPHDVNLGEMQVGEDRVLELHLSNQGSRLLYGSVGCDPDAPWLAVGDPPGAATKLFQFDQEMLIPVQVRGKKLRAGNKPLEGRLSIESNGGLETVLVRANVPVKPYPDGVLAGARSPRQVAEKAKVSPKDAAPLFEKGAVAQWYEANGWTYPVQGPSASGLGAVQQFFEALGLTPPPKVEINTRSISLQGNVGDSLKYTLEVKTPEKRPVYAHGVSDQSWLEVTRAQLNGRTATIDLVIPSVPNRPGEKLTGNVTVQANGNQRFVVLVSLAVTGGGGGDFNFFEPAAPTVEAPRAAAFADLAAPAPAQVPATAPPPIREEKKPVSPAAPPTRKRTAGLPSWIHLVPAGLLGLVLLGILAWDFLKPPSSGQVEYTEAPWMIHVEDTDPRLGIKYNSNMRFGLLMLKEKDPKEPDKFKRLTSKEDGGYNNTCVRLDGTENLFGKPPGQWFNPKVVLSSPRRGWMSLWNYKDQKVLVRQSVEIVPNEQTHLWDTALIGYEIENQDTLPHKVGLRVMLDTFIGANDGIPFVVPGQPGLLETMKVFETQEIPDYVEALERPDLKDPGTIAHLGLKMPDNLKIQSLDPPLDPITKMVICRWPGNSETKWDWEYKPMNAEPENKDSCVVLYWDDTALDPGAKRAMAFTYGLGMVTSAGSGQLGLSAGGSFRPGGVFTLTALVKKPEAGQKVKLVLPPDSGLSLVEGQNEEQTIDKGGDASQTFSWRIRSTKSGTYNLQVTAGVAQETYKAVIRRPGLIE